MSSVFLSGYTPRAIAHRGWHTGELADLENSMAAFRYAVAQGFSYVETDAQLTSDGHLIAFHDDRLDRVTDHSGPIATRTVAELEAVRVGGREPIPLLADVLEELPDTRFIIDAKTPATVGPLIDLARRYGDRICLGAFSGARLRTLRGALGPRQATSLHPREIAALLLAARRGTVIGTKAIAAHLPYRYFGVPFVTEATLAAAHRSGLEVHVWTIDDRSEMIDLLELGADGIMTDRPDVLKDVLIERGQWHG